MKKKLFTYIIIIALITIVSFVAYLELNKIHRAQIGSVTINGQVYKTTGSIPFEDSSSRDLLSQLVRLADLGDIYTSDFKITVDNNANVIILLYPPYDQSKQAVLLWLKNNGFDLINESNISFTYSEKAGPQ